MITTATFNKAAFAGLGLGPNGEHDPKTCVFCKMLDDMFKPKTAEKPTEAKAPVDESAKPADKSTGRVKFFDDPDPKTPEAAPGTGNREREALFRAVIGVERALAKLPQTHARVAGFLHGRNYKGTKASKDNALANYLKFEVGRESTSDAIHGAIQDVDILAEGSGIIVETPRYLVSIATPGWLSMFMTLLRDNEYPELLA